LLGDIHLDLTSERDQRNRNIAPRVSAAENESARLAKPPKEIGQGWLEKPALPKHGGEKAKTV
jgi:hypothetical protein